MILVNMEDNANSGLVDSPDIKGKKKRRILAFEDSSDDSRLSDIQENKENVENRPVAKTKLENKLNQRQRRELLAKSLMSSSDSDSNSSTASDRSRRKKKKKSPLKAKNNILTFSNNEETTNDENFKKSDLKYSLNEPITNNMGTTEEMDSKDGQKHIRGISDDENSANGKISPVQHSTGSVIIKNDDESLRESESSSLEEVEKPYKKRSKIVIESDGSDVSDNEKLTLPQYAKSIIPHLTDSSESDSSNVRIFRNVVGSDENSDIEKNSDNETAEVSGSNSSDVGSDSSSDSDSGPPIRIFRNKDNIGSSKGVNHFEEEDEERGFDEDDIVAISRHRKKKNLPSELEIKSETQRLVRESNLNLPYHIPEPKKLSDIMKRPVLSCHHSPKTDKIKSPEKCENDEVEKSPEKDTTPLNPIKNKRLLLLGKLPSLSPSFSPKIEPAKNTVIDLDEDEAIKQPSQNGVSGFIARFLKHSQTPTLCGKKKVKFNIIRKEEDSQGAIDLVPDVVVAEQDAQLKCVGSQRDQYERVRKTLSERMKKKRAEERIKKEKLLKWNNEELGFEEEEEEEELLDDEDWSGASDEEDKEKVDDEENASEERSEEENMQSDDGDLQSDGENGQSDDAVSDDGAGGPKKRISNVIDDADEESIPPPDADIGLSNSSNISKLSMFTSKSESLFPHHSSDGSLLLFDDSIKKTNQMKDDTFFESMIPLNQPNLSAISNSSKPNKFNDDDSYFCSGRSPNNSTSSQMKIINSDYESQFIDSDGFIKEPKLQKSMSSFLPPGAEDDNAIDCNMSQLLNLCSGNFPDSQVDAGKDENNCNESFGFKVEAAKANSPPCDKFSFTDNNEEEEEEEDEIITIVRRKPSAKTAARPTKSPLFKGNFFEEEAELSGEDVGSEEEEEDIGENEYEEEMIDEVLPSDKVMKQQVNKMHLKKMLEDDQHDIELFQEAFASGFVENKRKRKFRWKNSDGAMDESVFMSDDDDDGGEEEEEEDVKDEEESQWRMLRLEREEFLNKESQDEDPVDETNSRFMEFGKKIVQTRHNSDLHSELSKDSQRSTSLSNGFNKVVYKSSFLNRKPEILTKFAQYKEIRQIKGSVNSSKMVFKVASPKKNASKSIKKSRKKTEPISKKPRLDEDSNSVFNLFNS